MPRASRSSSRPSSSLVLRPFVAAIALAAAADGQPRSSWVQLFRTGKFWDQRYGNFAITTQDLNQIADNFGTPVLCPVDYNHGTSTPTTAEIGKAAGKIAEVEIRANGAELWGRVEWTTEAATRIEAGEYMAMSPTFSFNYKHSDGRAIGATLLAAALCNRPVLDGMAAVEIAAGLWLEQPGALQLASAPTAPFSFDEQRRRVQAALAEQFGLGLPEEYGPCCGCYLLDMYDGRAIFRVWREGASTDSAALEITFTIGADGAVTFTSAPAEVVATWTPLASAQETTMSKTITVKDAKGAEITLSQETVDAIVKAHAPAPAPVIDAAFTELKTTVASQGVTITELTNKNAALELAARTDKAHAKVETLINAGKAFPVERDELRELALSNETLFDKLTAKRPVIVELNHEHGSGHDNAQGTGGGAELELAVKAERDADPKCTPEQAYSRALDKNPKLYELASRQ